jgi:hypothetical protein
MDREKPPIEPGPEPDTSGAGVPDDTDERHGTGQDETPMLDDDGDVVHETPQ